ncbi:MAG: putative glycolipid-binding domain-containing protein [Actinomycetota bacterium]
MTELRMLCWRGPEPQRIDSAHVNLEADFLRAHGASLTASYVLDYRLETGPGWGTRELNVRSRGDGWWRSLILRRSASGEWSPTGRERDWVRCPLGSPTSIVLSTVILASVL